MYGSACIIVWLNLYPAIAMRPYAARLPTSTAPKPSAPHRPRFLYRVNESWVTTTKANITQYEMAMLAPCADETSAYIRSSALSG